MSELSARLSLYRAVDEAARSEPEKLEIAARLLPPYRDDFEGPNQSTSQALGWYEKFKRWAGDDAPRTVDLPTALEQLGGLTPARPSDAAQRLIALWIVASVFTDEEVANSQIEEALAPVFFELEGRGVVRAMVQAMRDPDIASRREDLSDLVAILEEGSEGGAPVDKSLLAALCPSTETVFVWVDIPKKWLPPGAPDDTEEQPSVTDPLEGGEDDEAEGTERELAVRITTPECCVPIGTEHLTPQEVQERINPLNWDECFGSFWCEMNLVDGPDDKGVFRVEERVGDCPDSILFKPCLKFVYAPIKPNEDGSTVKLQYDLCDEQFETRAPDERYILVDRGSILVKLRVRDGEQYACVRTTKTVYFTPALTAAPLAMIIDALGYAQGARELVANCLAS